MQITMIKRTDDMVIVIWSLFVIWFL